MHLEEGVMARRVTHVLEIVMLAPRAQAPLHVRGTHVAPPVGTEEDLLELNHAAVGEKQRRIIGRYQRRRRHDRVAALGKIIEKLAADGCNLHDGSMPGAGSEPAAKAQ